MAIWFNRQGKEYYGETEKQWWKKYIDKLIVDVNSMIAATSAEFDEHKTKSVLDHPDGCVTDEKIGLREVRSNVTGRTVKGDLTGHLGNLISEIDKLEEKAEKADAEIQTQLDEHKTEFDEHTNKIASDENAAHVKLSDSTVSDSDAENGYYAATPKAVNDLRLILTEKIEGAKQNLTQHSIHYGDSTNKPGHVYVTQELVATGTTKDDYTVPSIEAVINLKNSIDKKAEANIKKNPNYTTGDIIDTHLTVGNSGLMGARSFSSGGDEDSEGNSNIAAANDSATVGGYLNKVESTAYGSVILGGWDNTITPSFSAIMGGGSNQIGEKCYNSAIIGGENNELVGDADYMPVRGVIVGGQNNQIEGDGRNSVILGGQHNHIFNTNTAESSAIIGGYHALANDYNTAVGRYNIDPSAPLSATDTSGDVFVVGIGTPSARKNGFRVAYDGNCYAATAMNSTGADYAECFEWIDGNPENEDRVGLMTAFDGTKIRLANADDPIEIIGIVSAIPAVVGDNYADEWCGKYQKDKYGRMITEHKVYAEVLDDEGNVIKSAYEADEYVLNPDYNPDEKYIPRLERAEYDAVGTHGKLVVRDDGSCKVGDFCRSGVNGIATASESGFYVMERIDADTVRVYLK